MERTENRFVSGQKLGAHRINQLQNAIDAAMPVPSSGVSITTRGNFLPVRTPSRLGWFEAVVDDDVSPTGGVMDMSSVVSSSAAMFVVTASDNGHKVQINARGIFLVNVALTASSAIESFPFGQFVGCTLKTCDASDGNVVYIGGICVMAMGAAAATSKVTGASGAITRMINTTSLDGGRLRLDYNWTNVEAEPITDQNVDGYITILGPIR